MNDLVHKLAAMPTNKLEAIYNAAWRDSHNGLDTDNNTLVLAAVEFVCGGRGVVITGQGGAWEFRVTNTG